ncbi:DUF2155 domain-containing protein [Roseibaca sp. Y0-43]|uniref:DUF2155 domain-containing protein n=1 Tax=Roseibaca sp. Y0-43 TaxID=2816854 RepID=UPI001D0C4F63|nr:DUF2155 domain-containing protein [Roseibaca sp. Y0-43]MCC1480021.1 DUF2155 domain-containing protein [Roseibaca sp. Y0-43]
MRALAFALACGLLPLSLGAQDIAVPGQQERVLSAGGAVLRGLDKVAGTSRDIRLMNGQTDMIGHLQVLLRECRYPDDNPTGEAYAWIEVTDTRANVPLFAGWMIASSPALSALDHARYDLWVLSCITS